MQSNPYKSPPPQLTEEPSQRFRWRTLAVGLIGGVGVLYFIGGMFIAFTLGYDLIIGRPLYNLGPGFSREGCIIAVFCFLTGAWLLFAARQWWKGHWIWSILMVVTIIAVVQIADAMDLIRD